MAFTACESGWRWANQSEAFKLMACAAQQPEQIQGR